MLFVVERFTTPSSGCPYLRGVNLNFFKKTHRLCIVQRTFVEPRINCSKSIFCIITN